MNSKRVFGFFILFSLFLGLFCQTSFSDSWVGSKRVEISGAVSHLSFSQEEIGWGRNASGGELLTANVKNHLGINCEAGIFNDFFGLSGGFCKGILSPIEVKNQSEKLPNHALASVYYSGDAFFFPTGKMILNGSLRPYLSLGLGGGFLRVDLDNKNGTEFYNLPTKILRFGFRYYEKEFNRSFMVRKTIFGDISFRKIFVGDNEHFRSFSIEMISVGVGFIWR